MYLLYYTMQYVLKYVYLHKLYCLYSYQVCHYFQIQKYL